MAGFKEISNRFILLSVALVCLLCASNVKWGNNRWKGIIAFDGKGYYAYLPAIFIYNDLHFNFHDDIEKKYSGENTFYEYRVPARGGVTNKYFAGTAVVTAPFFLAAHLITLFTGGIADGYSFLYQLFVSLSAIFYAMLGLFFLRKFLRLYFIPENIISIVVLAVFFGTNLFYYTVFDPSQSHVYSFGIISAFLFFVKRYSIQFIRKDLIAIGLLFGLIFLIRPVNSVIALAIPFICGSRINFYWFLKNVFRKNSGIIKAAVFSTLIVSIQGVIYFIQTGNIFVDTYVVEHFNWEKPKIINFLFSYKKGFFVYTPLAFISLFGLIPLFKKERFSFWTFLFFFLITGYVFSSWWNWWYGGSFGARPYTEYLSLFALLLAILLSTLKKKYLKWMYPIIVFTIVLCQVQTYQYRYLIIHWEKMDKEHYWRVFMRIDQLMRKENANKDLLLDTR